MSEELEGFLGDGPPPYQGPEGLFDWLRVAEVDMGAFTSRSTADSGCYFCPQCEIPIAKGNTRKEKLASLSKHGKECPISHLYSAIVGILFSEDAIRDRALRAWPEPCRQCHMRGSAWCPHNKSPREECPNLPDQDCLSSTPR